MRELWRRREFAFELSRTSLRAQHYDTVFGQLWLVLNPLLLACVYFVLVDILRAAHRRHHVLRPPDGVPVRLLLRDRRDPPGASRSVVGGGRLILNTAFPRMLLPTASVIAAFMRFLPTLVIFIPVHLASACRSGPHLLWLIPVFGLFVVLATGLAMLVAAGQVYFRDLKNFLPYALRMWLYGSPILYFASRCRTATQFLLIAQPARPAADRVERHHRLRARAAGARDLALGAAWAFSLFVLGALFFISREREFAVRL